MTIVLTVAPGAHRYNATSPDWPDREAEGFTATGAVDLLLDQIDGSRPLPAKVVEVLTLAGGHDLVDNWDTLVHADDVAHLRTCPAAVEETLDRFGKAGVDPTAVPTWVAARVDIADAGVAHSRSMSPDDYWTWSDQFWTTCRSLPAWSSADLSDAAQRPLAWLEAGVSLEHLALFLEMNVAPALAGDGWEPLIQATDMPLVRLRDYLRAEVSVAEATTYERRIADGEDLETAIAALAALKAAPKVFATPDPWAPARYGP